MDATAILDYFAPLKAWLDEQNKGQKVAGDGAWAWIALGIRSSPLRQGLHDLTAGGRGSYSADQGPELPVGRVEQRLVIGWRYRPPGVAAGDDEDVLVMVPVAPRHFAFERSAAAELHCEHRAGFRNRFELDSLAEPDVAVRDGLGRVLSLTPDSE